MLTKLDLAKQFELVVQQEIKNYNDSLSQVFQKLQSMQDQITNNHKECLSKIAEIDSRQQKVESELSQHKETHGYDVKQLYSMYNNQAEFNARNNNQLQSLVCQVQAKAMHIGNFKENINNVHDQIEKYGLHANAVHKNIYTQLDTLAAKTTKDIARAKKEVQESPSELLLVKKDLQEQLAAYKVDVAGIMRELNIYKRECFIVEKKLETIFTTLKDLKGTKSS